MPPEILFATDACESVDIWARGCLVHELLTGKSPFVPANPSDVLGLLRNILASPITFAEHAHIGSGEARVLSALLQRVPDARLGSRAGGGHLAIALPEL